MTENLKKFLEAASDNAEMKEKLNKLSVDELIAKAAELGIELTEADFIQKDELDDDELDAVAGGSCACPMAGGGGGKDSENGKTYGCACVGYGQGGDGRAKDANCRCALNGLGYDNGLAI